MSASKRPPTKHSCKRCKVFYWSNNTRRLYCSNKCNAATSYGRRKNDPDMLESARRRSRNYYRKHKKLNPDRFRNNKLLNRYGLSLEQFNQIAKKQRYKCAICKLKIKLFVDHCHKTGKIRSLLCNGCNRGIGYFSENPKALREASKYVEKWVK